MDEEELLAAHRAAAAGQVQQSLEIPEELETDSDYIDADADISSTEPTPVLVNDTWAHAPEYPLVYDDDEDMDGEEEDIEHDEGVFDFDDDDLDLRLGMSAGGGPTPSLRADSYSPKPSLARSRSASSSSGSLPPTPLLGCVARVMDNARFHLQVTAATAAVAAIAGDNELWDGHVSSTSKFLAVKQDPAHVVVRTHSPDRMSNTPVLGSYFR
jgi:hypothetical protein